MNVQSQQPSTLQDFQIIQELGSGSFSKVYRVRRIADGQEYALKQVKLVSLKQREKQNALNEVRLLASITDKHIVAYKEAFLDDQYLCIVMELLSGGDVYRKIASARGVSPFQESDIWRALIHMTLGLKALHDKNVVHRDLKSANVFLGSDGTFKLGDLNVSKVAKDGFVHTQTGTPYYASPEVWRDKPYNQKSDIWSLGCVIYEMCCLQTPFRALDMDLLYKKVQDGKYEQIPAHYSSDLRNMISSLLKLQPNQRPTCDQILQNPIVQKHMNSIESGIEIKSPNKPLLETIQLPNNFRQLKNQMPKSKYENDNANTNVSAERIQDNRSTEKSTSPFRSPQVKIEKEIPINKSQVNVQQPPQQMKNSSVIEKNQINNSQHNQQRPSVQSNKTEKPAQLQQYNYETPYERAHQIKQQKEKEIKMQKEMDQLLKERREKDARDARLAREAREIQERQLQEAKLRESRETQRLEQEKLQKNQQQPQYRRVSPISVGVVRDQQQQNYIQQQQQPRNQHSYSPITRSLDQQNVQIGNNASRVNQPQQRPQISQSINVSQNAIQYNRPYYQDQIPIRQQYQAPQSAAPRQQQYSSPHQKPVTERYPHPQSAHPVSNVRDSQKTERPRVFPAQAKVTKQRYSDINIQKQQEFQSPAQPVRPAGKPSRPLSTNIYAQDRQIRQEIKPQYNLITGNYNHYYPIDNYHRNASDQHLIRMKPEDRQVQVRPQINNRKY